MLGLESLAILYAVTLYARTRLRTQNRTRIGENGFSNESDLKKCPRSGSNRGSFEKTLLENPALTTGPAVRPIIADSWTIVERYTARRDTPRPRIQQTGS